MLDVNATSGLSISTPRNNSGASAAVNETLKANAAMHTTTERRVMCLEGFPPVARWLMRRVIRVYVAMISNHSSNVCDGRIPELISGSPAYFWPVWFHHRKTPKRAATKKAEKPSISLLSAS
jgi:hypothetical protein